MQPKTRQFLFCASFSLAMTAAPSLGEEVVSVYRNVRGQLDQLEQEMMGQIDGNDVDGFLSNFDLPDNQLSVLRGWVEKVHKGRPAGEAVKAMVDLPLLGATTTEALVRNGRLVAESASGKSEMLKLSSVLLRHNQGRWILINDDLKPLPEIVEGEIAKASFKVRPLHEEMSMTATTTFVVKNPGPKSLERIPLYFRYPLDVNKATVQGEPLEAEVVWGEVEGRAVTEWLVALKKPLAVDETVELSFEYSACYEYHDLGRKPNGFTEDRGFILWESDWYPRCSREWNMLEYDMSISVDKRFVALTSGTLVDHTSDGELHTYRYHNEHDVPPYFLWGRYKETVKQVAGTKLTIMTPPDGVDPTRMMVVAVEAMTGLSQLLPPPATKDLKIVAVTRYGGYGPPGCLLLQDSYFDPEVANDPETLDFVAHELSHSWVGSLAEPSGAPLSFLSEGLATYLGTTVVELSRGQEASTPIWERNRNQFKQIAHRAIAPAELCERVQHSDNPMFRGVAYARGAYFLKELERVVGRKTLMKALADVLAQHRGRSFALCDMAAAIDKAAGKDMSEFWDAFLQAGSGPDFFVEKAGDDGLRRVTVRNLGSACFTPFDVVAYDGEMKELQRRTVVLGKKKQEVVDFGKSVEIAHVAVDPDEHVLQVEDRNDLYPDCLLSSADNELVADLILKLLVSFQKGDMQAFDALLTKDATVLPSERRERVIRSIDANTPINMSQNGAMRVFAHSGNRADVVMETKVEDTEGSRPYRMETWLIKEDDGWKVISLRYRWL